MMPKTLTDHHELASQINTNYSTYGSTDYSTIKLTNYSTYYSTLQLTYPTLPLLQYTIDLLQLTPLPPFLFAPIFFRLWPFFAQQPRKTKTKNGAERTPEFKKKKRRLRFRLKIRMMKNLRRRAAAIWIPVHHGLHRRMEERNGTIQN